MYIEITDPNVIQRLQNELSKNLKRHFTHKADRVIGWPSGHFTAEVGFGKFADDETSWWYTGMNEEKDTAFNLFGHGNSNDSKILLIDLQFNVPIKEFTRRQGGVFVQDLNSGEYLLGHRGIVTRGKSRVPRDLLLQEANVTPTTASSNAYPKEIELLLVSPINDPHLASNINDFSLEIRRAAYKVMENSEDITTKRINKVKPHKMPPLDTTLNDYFDEFIGKKKVRRPSQVTMDCWHGKVVRELRERLNDFGIQYKSKAIDLAVETDKEVLLFEVKAGIDSQSIYTGIGQLYFHASALSREFKRKPIVKHLVLPLPDISGARMQICKELGIRIVSFELSDQKINILHGL